MPGLRATADAEQLAEEIGFATGRLAELAAAPPGLYADAATAADADEGIWLAAQIVLLGPAEEADDPFAALRDVVVGWGAGAPDLEGLRFGPRSPFADAAARATLAGVAARLGRAPGRPGRRAGRRRRVDARAPLRARLRAAGHRRRAWAAAATTC